MRKTADTLLATGLAAAGYTYINMDDCWQVDRYANGTILADPTRFPYGIQAVAEYVHSKGLFFGLYTAQREYTVRSAPPCSLASTSLAPGLPPHDLPPHSYPPSPMSPRSARSALALGGTRALTLTPTAAGALTSKSAEGGGESFSLSQCPLTHPRAPLQTLPHHLRTLSVKTDACGGRGWDQVRAPSLSPILLHTRVTPAPLLPLYPPAAPRTTSPG